MRIFLLCQLLLCPFFKCKAICQVMGGSVIRPLPTGSDDNQDHPFDFPFGIKTVDRGSRDILAQKATGVENILQVKAARPDFDTTNLTVITSDGKLFSFLVGYTDQPLSLNIQINNAASKSQSFRQCDLNEAKVAAVCTSSYKTIQLKTLHVKDRSSQSELTLCQAFLSMTICFCTRLSFQITLRLKYEIENLRFFVRDKKTPKRTAIQETEIKPLHILEIQMPSLLTHRTPSSSRFRK
jgi:conjugative transposon TraN protein